MDEHRCPLPWKARSLQDPTMWVCPHCGDRWVAETVSPEESDRTFDIEVGDWAITASWGWVGRKLETLV